MRITHFAKEDPTAKEVRVEELPLEGRLQIPKGISLDGAPQLVVQMIRGDQPQSYFLIGQALMVGDTFLAEHERGRNYFPASEYEGDMAKAEAIANRTFDAICNHQEGYDFVVRLR